MLLTVLLRVLTNEVILAALLGVGFNIFYSAIPTPLSGSINYLSSSFTASMLFTLGLQMSNWSTFSEKQSNLSTFCLIFAKLLLLPIICLFIYQKLADYDASDKASAFIFLYSALPTAPPIYCYVQNYNTHVNPQFIGICILISTVLATPVIASTALFTVEPTPFMHDMKRMLTISSPFVAFIGFFFIIQLLSREGVRLYQRPASIAVVLVLSEVLQLLLSFILHTSGAENSHTFLNEVFHLFLSISSCTIWTFGVALSLVCASCVRNGFDRVIEGNRVNKAMIVGFVSAIVLGMVDYCKFKKGYTGFA